MAKPLSSIPCVSLTEIEGTDCIGDSRSIINTNVQNLGTGLCNLSNEVNTLSSGVTLLGNKVNVLVPTGAIMPFYRSTAPDGWLICNGAPIPSQFTSLIALVGANTPNLRGMFIRGWSPGTSTTSRDPLSASRTLGSLQEDGFERHTHSVNDPGHVHFQTQAKGGNGAASQDQWNGFPGKLSTNIPTGSNVTGISINSTGNTETRPVNIALLYCIKT